MFRVFWRFYCTTLLFQMLNTYNRLHFTQKTANFMEVKYIFCTWSLKSHVNKLFIIVNLNMIKKTQQELIFRFVNKVSNEINYIATIWKKITFDLNLKLLWIQGRRSKKANLNRWLEPYIFPRPTKPC